MECEVKGFYEAEKQIVLHILDEKLQKLAGKIGRVYRSSIKTDMESIKRNLSSLNWRNITTVH